MAAASPHCYLATIDDIPAGFIALNNFPHPKVKNYKKIHRLVVKPDYQGIGLGKVLLEFVSAFYQKKGFRVGITTSQPQLINYFKSSQKWRCIDFGRIKKSTGAIATSSSSRLTTSWAFKNETNMV